MIKNSVPKVQATFSIHLIAISGAKRRPKVRMLFVEASGADVVYEGQGSWSQCMRWIQRLTIMNASKPDLVAAKKDFSRSHFATLSEVRVPFLELESMGLQRVDK